MNCRSLHLILDTTGELSFSINFLRTFIISNWFSQFLSLYGKKIWVEFSKSSIEFRRSIIRRPSIENWNHQQPQQHRWVRQKQMFLFSYRFSTFFMFVFLLISSLISSQWFYLWFVQEISIRVWKIKCLITNWINGFKLIGQAVIHPHETLIYIL